MGATDTKGKQRPITADKINGDLVCALFADGYIDADTAWDAIAKRYRQARPEVPVVENLDRKILEAVDSGSGKLEMDTWHTCNTTHCRAGWAIHLAGQVGYDLEKKHGSERAGAMIYRASTGRVPCFFGSNEAALADLKRCAAEQVEVKP